MPETVSSITGGGGRHDFFGWNGVEVRNRTKIAGRAIDCRGSGGYVLVSPSNHRSGNRYRWERDPWTTEIAQAPAWLVDFVTGKPAEPAGTSPAGGGLAFTVAEPVERLSAAAGAYAGSRHDTATKLIGKELALGTDPGEIARLSLEWADRCLPPMDAGEILRIVNDLTAKHHAKQPARGTGTSPASRGKPAAAASEAEVEAVLLPEPAPWPILADDAYHGLAGEIVRMIEPETEADPVAILIQMLVSFGNVVGRQAHYIVEGTGHGANLFAVLVGSTARGRKGTSEGRCRQLLREVDPAWTLNNVKTGLVSGEGLVWHVRDPIYKTEQVKKDGKIVGTEQVLADPGIDDKRLLVVEPEFATVLRVCRREQNTLSATLRSAWDSGILRTLAKNSPATATDAHVSIIGHITQDELHRTLAEVEGFNGFANRFLWLAVRRSKLLPDGGQDLDFTRHAQRLALAAEQARSVERMHRDQGAAALWRRTYAELADDQAGGLLGAVTSRAEAQVLRLSMIYALLDGAGTITERHLGAGLAVWRYCRSSAAMIFGNGSGDPLADQVLAAIRQKPGISRWELHSTVCKHKPAAVLVQTLAKLRDAGRIETKIVTTAGRSAETWFPVQSREEREIREESRSGPDLPDQDQGLTSHTSLTSQGKPGMEVTVL